MEGVNNEWDKIEIANAIWNELGNDPQLGDYARRNRDSIIGLCNKALDMGITYTNGFDLVSPHTHFLICKIIREQRSIRLDLREWYILRLIQRIHIIIKACNTCIGRCALYEDKSEWDKKQNVLNGTINRLYSKLDELIDWHNAEDDTDTVREKMIINIIKKSL